MEHPKDVGDRTTLSVMLALRNCGHTVSVPFGENCRYDLVLDDGLRLARVQCKTGRLREGAVVFNTHSSYAHLPSPRELRRTYEGEIEYFGVYCAETASVYLVPIDDVACRKEARLRVTASRNGQAKRIRLARNYRVGTVETSSSPVTRGPRASSDARGSSA
jgi:hypothetical protein